MELLQALNEARLHSRIHFEGLDLSIEVPAGGYRRGVNKHTGEAWAHKIPANYGYIKGTHSPDGEHLDCYIRRNPKKNAKVYVVHQLTIDGHKFDEDKVMLGYGTRAEAVKAFKDATFKPSTMFGGVTEFDMEHFQLAAYSASKSHAMLTDNATYERFKKKGYLLHTIKSPNMIARKVSESLADGLNQISEILDKGLLAECLDATDFTNFAPIDQVLEAAYDHYVESYLLTESHELTEQEFKDQLLEHILENDALTTDTQDVFMEDSLDEVAEPVVLETVNPLIDTIEEGPVMEANNFSVVIHTQIMENIGTADRPSWATAGTRVQLVQEGFTNYGEARSVAARVGSGEIPVEIAEGDYVLGIDVMPTSDFKAFHEAEEVVEPTVEEETTDDVFFAQQVQETAKLAGVQPGSYTNTGTPTVQETRARLEALTQGFYEALDEDQENRTFPAEKLDEAIRYINATRESNPEASSMSVVEAICQKVYGDAKLAESLAEQALVVNPTILD